MMSRYSRFSLAGAFFALLAVLGGVVHAQGNGQAGVALTDAPIVVGPSSINGTACAGGEIYDDGSAENGYSGNPATVTSFEGVQQFTPGSYPNGYQTVCIGLVSLNGPTLDLEIEVRDDDGAGGTPGTLLGSVPFQATAIPAGLPCAFYSVDISSLNLNIASGSVFIGARWNPQVFPSRFVCADESPATVLHPGYINFNNPSLWQTTQTTFPVYRAKLIRAIAGLPIADVALSKTAVAPDPLLIGDTITYTLGVSNAGPGSAENLVITDQLPANVTYVSNTCAATFSAPTLTWNAGSLANAASTSCDVSVTVNAVGAIVNSASAATSTTDPNPADNTDSVNLDGAVLADLILTKTAVAPDPLVIGDSITYTLSATNGGPSDAENVVVTDTLPSNVSYVSNTCSANFADPTFTWNLGTLVNGASASCEVTATVNTVGAIVNAASAASSTPDSNPADNIDSVALGGAVLADVSIAISSNASPDLAVGQQFDFAVVASNAGPSDAAGLQLNLVLPGTLAFVSSNCSAVLAGNTVGWSVATLAVAATTACDITVEMVAQGSLAVSASVTATTPDPDLSNNTVRLSVAFLARELPTLGQFGVLLASLLLVGSSVLAIRRRERAAKRPV